MLIQEQRILKEDPILSMIASLNGNASTPREIRPGVYEVGHFGSSAFLREYEHYPSTTVGSYGVCDNVDQLLSACPELEACDRKFVVTLTPVNKADQSPEGGWRWHKWGPYIGTQDPQHEYLYDEPHIESVMCFHIYEKKETT